MKILKLFFILGVVSALTACVSKEESTYRAVELDRILRNQCQQTLRYAINSNEYANCYNQYKSWLTYYGVSMPLSHYKVAHAKEVIENLNQSCYTHWGTKNISPDQLRECVQSRLRSNTISFKRDEISQQEEENLQKSFLYEGDRQNRAILHLQMIEIERQKVARKTGKNPNEISCRMTKTISGKRKVICK